MNTLKEKVAIITGSTMGIGKAIALRLHAEGAFVVINSAHSIKEGEQLAKALPGAIYIKADISDESQCQHLIEKTIEHFGRLDILVNNAAAEAQRIPHDDLQAITDDIFKELFAVNVMGTWYMCRAAMPHLQASTDGAIVNISSIAGSRGIGASIPYCISKASVDQLTVVLANAFAPEVRVNAVAPGVISTRRTQKLGEEKLMAVCEQNTALGRPGKPEDIADTVLGVLSSKYMTGQIVIADGGYLL